MQMVRDLNTNYLATLETELPANRLGPTGDGPKLYCATCHQGAPKPLLGVSLAKDWPELERRRGDALSEAAAAGSNGNLTLQPGREARLSALAEAGGRR